MIKLFEFMIKAMKYLVKILNRGIEVLKYKIGLMRSEKTYKEFLGRKRNEKS